MARKRVRYGPGQLELGFGQKKAAEKKVAQPKPKRLSNEEKRTLKLNARRLAKYAYALLKSKDALRIFKDASPEHLEYYRKEIGRPLGLLNKWAEGKKVNFSAENAKDLIALIRAFFKNFGIKYRP